MINKKGIFYILCFFTITSYSFQEEKIGPDNFKNIIQAQLDSLYNESKDFVGATIGIVLPNDKKMAFAVGYADVENKIKMKPNDRMLGGSTGKIFVSASIMQLVEIGKLKLDDTIEKYLGDFDWYKRVQNHDKLTVRNLMQHASGISRYVFEDSFEVDIHKNADRIWNPSELIAYVLDKKPLFKAGTEFAYSDTNYILLGLVIEKVSNMSMYGYIDKHILKKYNLNSISPQIERKIEGLVVGYNKEDDSFYPGIILENGTYKYNVQFEWAGGGYVMNSLDLAQAGKLIYENKLFKASLMSEFLDGIDAKQLGGTWGLGVHIKDTPVGKSFGHSGFFPGYLTKMLYFPDYNFSIAFQVNTTDGKHLGLYRKLFKLIPIIVKQIDSN